MIVYTFFDNDYGGCGHRHQNIKAAAKCPKVYNIDGTQKQLRVIDTNPFIFLEEEVVIEEIGPGRKATEKELNELADYLYYKQK